jgi:hypothetical protein
MSLHIFKIVLRLVGGGVLVFESLAPTRNTFLVRMCLYYFNIKLLLFSTHIFTHPHLTQIYIEDRFFHVFQYKRSL